ncbi:MAG: NAD-dependent epimerase/dehydratase family protein [Reinekea sp.]
MAKVLITGANGFVGRTLVNHLRNPVTVSREAEAVIKGQPHFQLSSFEECELLDPILGQVDCIVHLAALAHKKAISLEEFMRVNRDGTLRLAGRVKAAGVRRFIFISSIGVNGVFSDEPFRVTDTPKPLEPYAESKLATELALKELFRGSTTELVIIRPPLVYGPTAPGNFGSLIKLVCSKLPVPLGSVRNKRSLIALDNLVDIIKVCIEHPKAANQTFLVSDEDDVSTTELLKRMARAFGVTQWLIPVPKWLLMLLAKFIGKGAAVDRLFGSLQVDITHTKETLGWKPPVTMEEQLRKIAESLTNK